MLAVGEELHFILSSIGIHLQLLGGEGDEGFGIRAALLRDFDFMFEGIGAVGGYDGDHTLPLVAAVYLVYEPQRTGGHIFESAFVSANLYPERRLDISDEIGHIAAECNVFIVYGIRTQLQLLGIEGKLRLCAAARQDGDLLAGIAVQHDGRIAFEFTDVGSRRAGYPATFQLYRARDNECAAAIGKIHFHRGFIDGQVAILYIDRSLGVDGAIHDTQVGGVYENGSIRRLRRQRQRTAA